MFEIPNSIQQVYRFYTYRNVGLEHRNDIGCVLLQCIGLSWVPLGELGGGYLLDRWNIGISGLSFASLHHLTTISTSSHNHLHYHHGILFTASILTKLGLFFFRKKVTGCHNIYIEYFHNQNRVGKTIVSWCCWWWASFDCLHLHFQEAWGREAADAKLPLNVRNFSALPMMDQPCCLGTLVAMVVHLFLWWYICCYGSTFVAMVVHLLLWWYICCYGGTFDAMVVHLMLKWYICCCWKNVTANL